MRTGWPLKVDDEALGFAASRADNLNSRSVSGISRDSPSGVFERVTNSSLLGEIDVFPPLAGDLAAPHAGVERGDDHGVEVILGGAEKQLLLGDAQDLPPGPPLAGHLHPGERICSEELLIDRPVENVPEHAQVPVDGRVLDGRVAVLARARRNSSASDLVIRSTGMSEKNGSRNLR